MYNDDKIKVPVLGVVENMSWFTPRELPENKYYIFGKNGGKKLAEEFGVPFLGQIPIVQSICEGGDIGTPSSLNGDTIASKYFNKITKTLVEITKDLKR